MTKARKLIDGSAFDPDTVKMMGDVLEGAWVTIEPALRAQSPTTIESARRVLATTILSSVAAGLVSPDILRDEAVRVVKRNFPQHLT
jgi:hypothetical protein